MDFTKSLFLLCIIVCSTFLTAQKADWFNPEYRKIQWPDSIYYYSYAESLVSKKEARKSAEEELSKKISTEISVISTSTSSTINAELTNIFNEISKSETQSSISGLKEEYTVTLRKKRHHILLYIKKDDLRNTTRDKYKSIAESLNSEISACQEIYKSRNYKQAKIKADWIDKIKIKLERLKNMLDALGEKTYNAQLYHDIVSNFEPLYANIKKYIQNTEDYRYNKDQGDLHYNSNTDSLLVLSLSYFNKAKRIDPNQAKLDGLPTLILDVKDRLYNIYCMKALNAELEKKYVIAVNHYKKARNIFQDREVKGLKETTTQKIIQCQNLHIDVLIDKASSEMKDSPFSSKRLLEEAKELSDIVAETQKMKEINKLIDKCQDRIDKIKSKQERKDRREELIRLRKKSPHRFVWRIGAGLHTVEKDYSYIYDESINTNKDNWNLSGLFGYRVNLPDEIQVSKTGLETSKANVIGIFYNTGNVHTYRIPKSSDIVVNESFISSKFQEFEIGFINKEWLRISAGYGSRKNSDLPEDILKNYFIATGGLIFHFGRVSSEITVSYLLNDNLEPQHARFNAALGIRYYFFKKVFKTYKANL